jgi:hypothetical protein
MHSVNNVKHQEKFSEQWKSETSQATHLQTT